MSQKNIVRNQIRTFSEGMQKIYQLVDEIIKEMENTYGKMGIEITDSDIDTAERSFHYALDTHIKTKLVEIIARDN